MLLTAVGMTVTDSETSVTNYQERILRTTFTLRPQLVLELTDMVVAPEES